MGQSKEMFLELQARHVAAMYAPDFTKKQAQQAGFNLAKSIVDGGEVDKIQAMANLVRLQEVIVSAVTEMRNYLPDDKITAFGVEFTPTSGGNTVNYEEDSVYAQIKKDLGERAELLKLAQKQELVLDAGGNEVPRVSTTPRKSSVTIKF